MKRLLLICAMTLIMTSVFARSWWPNHKYAKWIPTFSIDKIWEFSTTHQDAPVLEGCALNPYPRTISWTLVTWSDRNGSDNDYDMKWAEIYLYNDSTKQEFKICKVDPDYRAHRGWRLKALHQNEAAGHTYRVREVFRGFDDGSGVLYFTTFYTDSLANFIAQAGSKLGVHVCCEWDHNKGSYAVENARTLLDAADRQTVPVPATPSINSVSWNVHNNQTCVAISHNIASQTSLELTVSENGSAPQRVDYQNNQLFYHSNNLNQYFQSGMSSDDFMNLSVCTRKVYTFPHKHYSRDAKGGGDIVAERGTTAYKYSVSASVKAPALVQPNRCDAFDMEDGRTAVLWSVQPFAGSNKDRSPFIVECSTNPNFPEVGTRSYSVAYNDTATYYSCFDAFPERNQNNVKFYYRIHRQNAAVSELRTVFNKTINTNYASLNRIYHEVDTTTATKKLNLYWTFNPGIRNTELKLKVTYGSQNFIVNSSDNPSRKGIVIPSCIPTTFKAQLYTNNWSSPVTVETKATLPLNHKGVIESFIVTPGYFNDHVDITWNVDKKYPFFSQFQVVRTEYNGTANEEYNVGSPVPFTPNVYSYSVTDYTGVPGVYYEYKLVTYAQCDSVTTQSNDASAVGFARNIGVVSGQITYSGNQAVENVAVVAQGEGMYNGKSLSFNATNKPIVCVPAKYVSKMFSKDGGTIEFFVRLPDRSRYNPIMLYQGGLGIASYRDSMFVAFTDSRGAVHQIRQKLPTTAEPFYHVAVSYSNNSGNVLVSLFLNGVETGNSSFVVSENAGDSIAFPNASGDIYFGYDGASNYMTGNLDEIRFWNKKRDAQDIARFMSSYLDGSERGLTAYYRCDDDVNSTVFDVSKINNTYNGRHLRLQNVYGDSRNIPSYEQLAHKAYTDSNGHYTFNNIPFSNVGTQYSIIPVYGTHEFAPATRPLYFNASASTHNSVDFTDVSSFKVSGTVYYLNTNFPVEGCQFEIDGVTPCTKDNNVILTNEKGEFTIDVPIGKHYIKVSKTGHTFSNGGRYPATGTIDFNKDVNGLVLRDSTFLLVTGRVSGGSDEANKPHGFGEGRARIGQARIVITPVGSLYDLNMDKTQPRIFTMPDSLKHGTRANCHSVATTGPNEGDKARSITIMTDSFTGEFNVLLPPMNFSVKSAEIVHNNDHIQFPPATLSALNLSEAALKQTQNVDSLFLDSLNLIYFNYSKALDVIHYSNPDLKLSQYDTIAALGAADYIFTDSIGKTIVRDTVKLFSGSGDSVVYTVGYPCFQQNDVYMWKFKASERYVNYDKAVPDVYEQPFRYGIVEINSNFSTTYKDTTFVSDTTLLLPNLTTISLSANQVMLDYTGMSYYKLKVGEPSLLSPYTSTFQITYSDYNGSREYDWSGTDSVVVMGLKSLGNKVVTGAPDEVFYVLRDPMGSDSYATWKAGETITKTVIKNTGGQWNWDGSYLGGFDAQKTMILGLPPVEEWQMFFNSYNHIGEIHNYSGQKYPLSKKEWTLTNEQTVSTSNDHTMVGSCADVYIGKAKNYIFATAAQIGLKYDTIAHRYVIGKRDAVTFDTELSTQFHFSQYYIETFLIPLLKQKRNSMLVTVSDSIYNSGDYVNNTRNNLYITNLPNTDSDFGNENTYRIILPSLTMINDLDFAVFPDSVGLLNSQVKQWEKVMADNEHAKVIVHHSTAAFNQSEWENVVYPANSEDAEDQLFNSNLYGPAINSSYNSIDSVAAQYKGGWLIGNYTLGAGADYSASQTRSYSNISSGKHEEHNFLVGLKWDAALSVATLNDQWSEVVQGGFVKTSEKTTEKENTSEVTYNVIMDSYEAISYDVYQAPDGFGPIFSTRGGNTYCPYEGADSTKYYMNSATGKPYELHSATVSMAKPKITVSNPKVVNVPVGQKALFNINLGNEATTTAAQVDFVLCEDMTTNPYGAMLKMDGAPVTYNGQLVSLNGGVNTNKIIELAQTREDILTYDSIALIFKTDCYKYDADTIYISAHFVPTCSEIVLTADKNIVNNQVTDTTVHFTISGFVPDFRNFNKIQFQYKTEGSNTWNVLKSFNVSSDSVPLYYDVKFKPSEYPDGTYKFRAATLCGSGASLVTNESAEVEVTVDLTAPVTLGTPNPVDGIYSASSQIYADFSEPIQPGQLQKDKVSVQGVLNSHVIQHGITLDLENNPVYSSATYNFDSVPFTLEMWINYSAPGKIFGYADASSNGISFAIDNNNKLKTTVNGQVFISDSVMRPNEWCYLWIECNPVTHSLHAAYAYENKNINLYPNGAPIPAITIKGNIFFGGDGLKAKIHEAALWNTTRPLTTALAQRSESKSPYTPGLISLWHMNEGKGFKAEDCIRHRDLILSADAWAYNYSNYALHIPAGATASVDIATSSISEGQSYLFEFWFRAIGDAHLFHLSNDSISVSIQNKNLTFGNGFTYPIRNYTDSTWHHFALIYKNTSTPMIAIDGVQLSSYTLLDLPHFQSNAIIFGSANASTTHNIDIDEVRLWNINTTLEAVRLYRGTCLTGTETGLLAYYPMERTYTDVYNQKVTEFSLREKKAENDTTYKTITYSGSTPAQATTSPALVESRPVENVTHHCSVSEDRVVINIDEPAARIEGCTLEFLIQHVVDRNGNFSQPIRWTAFVNRNQLLWDEDVVEIVKGELVDTTFYITIINSGSQAKNWTIDNVPSWLTLSLSSGYLQPLQRQTISCTINSSLGRGDNEHILYLSSDDEIERPLYINTRVFANKPNWNVNADKYSRSMNLITCAEINGVMADDPEDMVAAFIGNELVGVAKLQLFPAIGRYYAMMTIYPGTTSANQISFRYWDASNGTVYNNISIHCFNSQGKDSTITHFAYSDETICGDINHPYLLKMGTEIEQTINMHRGWNWISVNVSTNQPTLNSMWSDYISDFSIIKDQKTYSQTDSINNVVRGTLDTMRCGMGYKINALKNFTAKITGNPASIYTSVKLAPGSWTWIGYVPQTAMTVNAALSNINPSTGDLVKSQQKFATWDGAQWIGTLTVMEPGVGYSYKNTGSEQIILSYPEYNAFAYNMPARMPEEVVDTYFEPVDPGKYQGNMTMTAVVAVDGQNVEGAEVAIFAGAECRAVSTCYEGYYFLTIPGESATPLTIKVVYNDSVYAIAEGFTFTNDSAIGNLYEPYIININTGTTSVVNVNASASDKVEKVLINDEVFIIRNGEYYDALGRRRNKPEDRKK